MAKKVVGLLSGKTKHKITGEFVSLDNTEQYLGVPDSNNSIIISHTDGSRNFYKLDSSLTLDNINSSLSVNFPSSIDSAYVQLRQIQYNTSDFVDSAFVATQIANLVDGAPVALDTLNELATALQNDSDALAALVTVVDTKLNTAGVTSLIDSAYIQLRDTPQDFAYSSLTGAPTTVSTFTNDANYLDSTSVTGVIDATYVQARQITYDFLDSSEVINLIDSAYINLRADQYNNFDTDFAAKSTSDLSEGSNLYYTKARADSDIASSLSDSTNTVNITINNTILDTVDSAYVLARINEAPFLDSADAINLIDSAYVQQRQDYAYASLTGAPTNVSQFTNDAGYITTAENMLDSAEAIALIDSTYVQARQDFAYASLTGSPTNVSTFANDAGYLTDADTLDSAEVIGLVDSAYVQLRQTPQDFAYASLTGTPTNVSQFSNDAGYLTDANTLDSAEAIALIDSAYVQARQDFAYASLTGSPTNVSDFTNDAGYLTNADTLDSAEAIALIDSAYVQLRQTPQDFAYSSLTGTPTIPVTGIDFADSAWITLQINNLIDGAPGTLNTLNEIAAALNDDDSAYNTLIGLIAAKTDFDSAATIDLIDSAYIELRRPAETIFTVVNNGSSAYTFTGDGFSSGRDNPTLYLTRGKTYKFGVGASGHPFQIRSSNGGSAYNTGVTNNGAQTGNILFTPDMNAPTSLVYQCTIHSGMVGNIVILDDTDAVGLDSASVSQLIDSAYIQLRDTPQDFAYSSLTGTPTIPVTGIDFADSSWILDQIPQVGVDYVDSAYVASVLPKTGVDFADSSWIVANFLDSALTTQLILSQIDSAYVQLRQTGSGGTGADSAFVLTNIEQRSLDSERTTNLIDSAYIQLRQTSVGTGGLDSALTAQLIDSAYIQLRQTSGGTTDSATVLALIDSAHVQARQSIEAASPLILTNLIYTADSGQVTFTGTDDNGTTLTVDSGKLQVFLNGILLSDADFSHNASKVDLTIAADSGDILTVVKIGGNSGVSGFQQKHFIYNADSGQTVFTGAATSGEVLAYSNFNRTNVYLNGIMLISGTDYIATNGTTVTLIDAADSGDVLDVNTFIGSNIGLDSADVTNLIDSAYITARAGAGTDSAAVIQLIDSAYVVARAGASTDSATVLNLIDSSHVALKAIGLDYAILANKPTIPVSGTDFADSAWITAQIDALVDGAPGTLNTLNEIAAALNDDDSAYGTLLALINAKSNVDSIGSLSNVTYGIPTAGQILKYDAGTSKFILATDAGGLDSSLTSQLIDSAYVQARGTGSTSFELTNFIYTADSGQVTFTGADDNSRTLAIDSGKLQVFLNGILLSDADFSHNASKVDLTIAADSADILTIVKMDGNNTTSNFQSKHFIYNADSGQTTFTGAAIGGEVLRYSNADRTNVYLNGIMLINGTDFTATNGSTLTLTEAADSGDVLDINVFRGSNISLDSAEAIALIDSAHVQLRQTPQDFAYSSLTGAPTNVSDFTNDAGYLTSATASGIDSAAAISLITAEGFTKYDSANTTGMLSTYATQTYVTNAIDNLVDGAPGTLDTLNEIAAALNDDDSAYGTLLALINAKTNYDSANTIGLIDSAYVQLRQTAVSNAGLDSALTIQLIDSAYVAARSGGGTADSGTITSISSRVWRMDSLGELDLLNTHTGLGVANGDANVGDIAYKLNPFDGYVLTNIAAAAAYSSTGFVLASISGNAVTRLDFATLPAGQLPSQNFAINQSIALDAAGTLARTVTAVSDTGGTQAKGYIDVTPALPSGFPTSYSGATLFASTADQTTWQTFGIDSAIVTSIVDSDYVKLRITKSDLDMEGNKVLFANVYDSVGSLPSATTYHGMFAHVHATGAGYFAHAGNWTRLANQSELSSAGLDSALTTQLIDSAYVQLRQSASGGSGTVDSAYVEANSLDSERTLLLIDSDYVLSRTATQPGEFNTDRKEFTVGGADSGRRVFDTNNTLSLVSGNTDVFLNGILQISGTDYTIDSSAVTFTSGVAANHQVTVVERSGKILTQRGLVENTFAFTTATPTTSITGTDDKGATLDVSVGYADVFLNGILLRDSDDYSINGAGTTLTLVSATDSSDIVTIKNSKGVIVTPHVKKFEYTTASPTTTISGNDLSGNTLAYVPGSLQVHLNGILLQEASDFTASTGNSIVLTTATDSADDVTVSAFSAPGSKLELYKFTADSGQTVFSGNDTAGRFMSYEPGNIQVFLNGLLLNDSDDYTASNTKAVRLLTAAALNDELKVAAFETTSEITRSNTWTAPSGTVSAVAGDKLFIDTSGGARIVTLPSSATMGDEIRIIDVTGNAASNNITVSRNSHNIQGTASDLVINIARAGIGLVYYNVAQGWVLIEN